MTTCSRPRAALTSERVCDASCVRPTLYEFAGGEPAFLALAQAHHARCLADPELNHPFSHGDQNPQHIERLAAYWGQVLGGPPMYTEVGGEQSALLEMHSGNGDMSDLGRRFVDCFVAALDDAHLPTDPEFRAAMRAYMESAVVEFIAYPEKDAAIPVGRPVPGWSWDGPRPARSE